jgi:hypothetical protein
VCTVSVVPRQTGFRLVCNRDERRTRPAAVPPSERRLGPVRAVWPIDPAGGGTWIGANDAGLVMAVLNRAPAAPPRFRKTCIQRFQWRRRSRGTIIPRLLPVPSLAAALDRALDLNPAVFEPFELLMLQRWRFVLVTNVNRRIEVITAALVGPLMFTSSSLGDWLVQVPRQALFTRLVDDSSTPILGQGRFHRHRWRARPEISVLMSRSDAATVSRTIVDVDAAGVRMHYRPLGDIR